MRVRENERERVTPIWGMNEGIKKRESKIERFYGWNIPFKT